MAYSLPLLFQLIEEAGTLEGLRDLLRARQRPFSAGSWESMFQERIRPALEDGAVSVEDLVAFLRDSEDYGRQHIFLFRRRTGSGLPDNGALRRWLKSRGAESVMDRPLLVDKPDEATISEVRREQGPRGGNLVVKIIETREYRRRIGEEEQATKFIVTYNREIVRAVNVARMHGDGLLEVRVYSHRNTVGDYRGELSRLLGLLGGLLNVNHYSPWSIHRAKNALVDKRHALSGVVRYSDSQLRNDRGSVLSLATGPQEASLFEDDSAEESHKAFLKRGDGHCAALNVWWLKQKLNPPSREVHVLLSGEPHEFAVTQQCTPPDYEHVLAAIRRLNR